MIVFKIASKLYPFPTRWEDVTYRQYLQLIYTYSLTDHIHVFTGIPRETLEGAEIKGLEKISIALSFLSISPNFERTPMVGPYVLPLDCTVQSTGQFEALRKLLTKLPDEIINHVISPPPKKAQPSIESLEHFADACLTACAIYCQKLKEGKFDINNAMAMKEELKDYPCGEVIGTGSFFLFKPLNTSAPITHRFRNFIRRMKRLMQGFPGYQKALDLMLRFFGQAGK